MECSRRENQSDTWGKWSRHMEAKTRAVLAIGVSPGKLMHIPTWHRFGQIMLGEVLQLLC